MARVARRTKDSKVDSSKIALAYVRVSTEEQADGGVSLAAQTEAVRAYLSLRGLVLHPAGVLVERAVSGGVPLAERPEGKRIVSAIAKGEAAHVVAVKLDRLFRNTADCLNQLETWEDSGVALHLTDMGGQAIDTSSTMGRFMVTVLAGVAEMERGLIKDRTRAALRHKALRGEKTGGDAPYGYQAVKVAPTAPTTLVEAPGEQAVVARARSLRATGLSLRAVAVALDTEGHRTRTGNPWQTEQIRRLVAKE
jgi:DNA invertase Pin-like site-specific DNA recombinase